MMKRLLLLLACAFAPALHAQEPRLADQVEIIRTAYGVPHIRAQNFRAAGYGLGWVQMEDYGAIVTTRLLRARGELARVFGHDSIASDFLNQPNHRDAARGFPLLDADTRAVYEGFAEAINDYVRKHPAEFAKWVTPDFTPIDALANDMELQDDFNARNVVRRLEQKETDRGSNAWAFSASRTKSGKAILLRNPHLGWDAGYYEFHLTIPGQLDFYGDLQVGGPFQTVGGFNRYLGWATTNNNADIDEVYALTADPAKPDHVLFNRGSIPLRREVITVAFRNGDALSTESRELFYSPVGRVVHRANGKVYAYKRGGEGDPRIGQLWLRMMRAQNLQQWQDALRMLAKPYSNMIYADAAGNSFYVWYGQIPRRTRTGADTVALEASMTADVWTSLVPFDSLPQLLNPKGGYIHNENDSFHYTNLNEIIPESKFPPPFAQPRLGLRSQLALQLISGTEKLSLEDVIRLKHSPRMLLADRVKPELITALKAANLTGDAAAALAQLEQWDNTTAINSHGGLLFEAWWSRYSRSVRPSPYRVPWTKEQPTSTPYGIANTDSAVSAFTWAVDELKRRYGSWDFAWGDMNRVRYGKVDVPVMGCAGSLGCFRTLTLVSDTDGKRGVIGGDGWISAVEFGKVPRAFTINAYGQSARPESPHYDDQAAMFARGELKPVAFTKEDVDRQAIRRYKPE